MGDRIPDVPDAIFFVAMKQRNEAFLLRPL
jgi:hypothetical protein